MKRRVFLKSAMATGAGLLLFPNGLRGQSAPSNKLNIALIGTWGRGLAHFDSIADENVVALCDVWDRNLADAAKRFPNAKTYSDWRKCLEQKDIDAKKNLEVMLQKTAQTLFAFGVAFDRVTTAIANAMAMAP